MLAMSMARLAADDLLCGHRYDETINQMRNASLGYEGFTGGKLQSLQMPTMGLRYAAAALESTSLSYHNGEILAENGDLLYQYM